MGPKQRKWLSPSTPDILDANTHKCVLVVPIAFTTDHIETLDEIDLEFKEDHADKNEHIEVFDRVDCFNDMPEFTDLTARILKNHIDDNFTTKIRGQCQNCDGKDCRNMRKYAKVCRNVFFLADEKKILAVFRLLFPPCFTVATCWHHCLNRDNELI